MPNSTNVIHLVTTDPTAYLSPFLTDVPDGYDTVWGYLAKEEPHVLDIMTDPVRNLIADQHRARIVSLAYGHEFYQVTAPSAVMGLGFQVLAFKLEVLRQVFPANP